MAVSTSTLAGLLPKSSDPSELRQSIQGLVLAADRSVITHKATNERLTEFDAKLDKMDGKLDKALGELKEIHSARTTDKAVSARTWVIIGGAFTVLNGVVAVLVKLLIS